MVVLGQAPRPAAPADPGAPHLVGWTRRRHALQGIPVTTVARTLLDLAGGPPRRRRCAGGPRGAVSAARAPGRTSSRRVPAWPVPRGREPREDRRHRPAPTRSQLEDVVLDLILAAGSPARGERPADDRRPPDRARTSAGPSTASSSRPTAPGGTTAALAREDDAQRRGAARGARRARDPRHLGARPYPPRAQTLPPRRRRAVRLPHPVVHDPTNQFKNGNHIDVEGTIFKILEFQHVKPGKGGAFVRTKLRRATTARCRPHVPRGREVPAGPDRGPHDAVPLRRRHRRALHGRGAYEQIALPETSVAEP